MRKIVEVVKAAIMQARCALGLLSLIKTKPTASRIALILFNTALTVGNDEVSIFLILIDEHEQEEQGQIDY